MKLKIASKIQKVLWLIIWFLMLPFAIVGILLDGLTKPFRWILDELDSFRFCIGNKLLRMTDEVKDGTIKNKNVIYNSTSTDIYVRLKIEQQRKLK